MYCFSPDLASSGSFIANPLDDKIGGKVYDERHHEQDQPDHEQHAVVRFTLHRLPSSAAIVAVSVRMGSSRLCGI